MTATDRVPRSLLFIKGHDPSLAQTAARTSADGLLLDFEDAVPAESKPRAREEVAGFLSGGDRGTVFVRVNAHDRTEVVADIEALAGRVLSGIFAAKVESIEQIEVMLDLMNRHRVESPAGGVPRLVCLLESAAGIVNGHRLFAAVEGAAGGCLSVGRGGDLHEDLGYRWSLGAELVQYARAKMIFDARAAGVDFLVDGSQLPEVGDEDYRADCERSAAMGFRGRIVLDESQAAIANAVYGS